MMKQVLQAAEPAVASGADQAERSLEANGASPRRDGREGGRPEPARWARSSLPVPPARDTVAEQWLATIAPATTTDVNPVSGAMTLVV